MGSEDRKQSQQWLQMKDDMKNIGESLKSRYFIELKIRQKGTPFLNFEVSKLALALLHLPPADIEKSAETYLATATIRDICLSNQHTAQQHVILRSANHIVEDQVRFSEADISEARRSSFELS